MKVKVTYWTEIEIDDKYAILDFENWMSCPYYDTIPEDMWENCIEEATRVLGFNVDEERVSMIRSSKTDNIMAEW